MPNRIQEKYTKDILPLLQKKLGISNILAVPRIKKIVVSIGMGESILTPASMEKAADDLALITGQRPLHTKAKKSIATFKLRAGMKIGLKVTLRGERMYTFFDRLISIALPRVRDFRGVSARAFDGHGNYNLGLKEQIVFPEIEYDKIDKIRGLQVTIITSAQNDEAGKVLLAELGMPFND